MKRRGATIALIVFWCAIGYVAWSCYRTAQLQLLPSQVWTNLKRMLRAKRLEPARPLNWPLATEMRDWGVKPPLRVALPPQYADPVYGNAGLVLGDTGFAGASFVSAPFPHPALHVSRPGGTRPYDFDSRSINAVLVIGHEGRLWPFGYTAFIDLVHELRAYVVPTPVLTSVDGQALKPVRVRSLSSLNEAQLGESETLIKVRRWAPVIWEFPSEGRLAPGNEGRFAIERDGTLVSWLPPLPVGSYAPVGLMLLQSSIPPNPPSREPEWWELDEKLRRQVLAGASFAEIRPILEELEAWYPGHPLLDHYRVVARLHDGDFTSAWLAHQSRECDLSTWQLLPWTTATPLQVAALPCVKARPSRGDAVYEHVFGAVLLRFRDQPGDALLKDVASTLIHRSFHRSEPNGFNFVTTDFAALWAPQHP